VPTRFRREFGDQEGDDLSADDRDEDDQCAEGARWRELIRRVVKRKDAEKGYVVNETDEVAEDHGAQTGDQTDDNRQKRKPYQA